MDKYIKNHDRIFFHHFHFFTLQFRNLIIRTGKVDTTSHIQLTHPILSALIFNTLAEHQKKFMKALSDSKKVVFLQRNFARELSSVGLEHLPYKQRVTSSNLVVPTNRHLRKRRCFFYSHSKRLALSAYVCKARTKPSNMVLAGLSAGRL